MLPKLMIAATALLLLAAPVSAQDTDNSKAAIEAMSKVTNAKDFVAHAAMSDMFEIQTGQMAQDQGGSDAVKQFGQMLVTDHGSSSRELMDVAKAAGVDTAPPSALDQRHQVIADSLRTPRSRASMPPSPRPRYRRTRRGSRCSRPMPGMATMTS